MRRRLTCKVKRHHFPYLANVACCVVYQNYGGVCRGLKILNVAYQDFIVPAWVRNELARLDVRLQSRSYAGACYFVNGCENKLRMYCTGAPNQTATPTDQLQLWLCLLRSPLPQAESPARSSSAVHKYIIMSSRIQETVTLFYFATSFAAETRRTTTVGCSQTKDSSHCTHKGWRSHQNDGVELCLIHHWCHHVLYLTLCCLFRCSHYIGDARRGVPVLPQSYLQVIRAAPNDGQAASHGAILHTWRCNSVQFTLSQPRTTIPDAILVARDADVWVLQFWLPRECCAGRSAHPRLLVHCSSADQVHGLVDGIGNQRRPRGGFARCRAWLGHARVFNV